MDRNPRVTILIAHHNYEDYLEQCIQSAKSQVGIKCHICVVDDGSNNREAVERIINNQLFDGTNEDGHPKTGETFMLYSDREVLRGPNSTVIYIDGCNGPSYARNRGIEETIEFTDYYLILDADDVAAPNKVKSMLEQIQAYDGIGVVYADYDIENVHTGSVKREFKEPYSLPDLYRHCLVHSGSLVSKEALLFAQEIDENKQFYDERLRCAEDYDLWLRIAQRYMISHLPENLTLVRVHNQNSTESVSKDTWNKCLNIVRQKHNGQKV